MVEVMFKEKYKEFLDDFGEGRTMVLSTSANEKFSSRMMSIVQHEGVFYFQTDRTMRKYWQICENRNVALCIDNIQIEGKADGAGRPNEHKIFSELFRKQFKGSADAYSSLDNERVFEVRPTFIQRWLYIDGVPYIERFFINDKRYSLEKYDGK